MIRRLASVETTELLAICAWVCCSLFVGEHVGRAFTNLDPMYFCQYGSTCSANNETEIKCCRDLEGNIEGEFTTAIFTCRAVCSS